MDKELRRKNTSLTISLVCVVAGMLMLSYAAVPLYDMFCRITGYGGTPKQGTTYSDVILGRQMNVGFNTDTRNQLDWEFKSLQKDVTLAVGERKLVFFEATNHASHPVKAMAAYNVTPFKVGSYFVKVQCFCYEEQELAPGETVRFPVSFYIDPELDKDENLNEVKNITLSYTFFPVKE